MSTDAEEEEILTHALALESSQGDGKTRLENFAYRVSYRRARPLLWQIAARGLMSVRLLARMLPVLALDVEHAAIADLWASLQQTPPGLGKLIPCLLDDYPVAVDTLLMHALFREPDSAAPAILPAHVAAALPLVRRRLGQGDAAPGLPLLRQIVSLQVRNACLVDFQTVAVTTFENGHLGHAMLGDEVEQLTAFAAVCWTPAVVERELHAALLKKRQRPLQRWAARAATDAASPAATPEAALERLRRTPTEDWETRDRLARMAAARFHAAGLPVPAELDDDIVFAFNPPRGYDNRKPTPGWSRAIEELRAFPRDRLHRRFDAVVSRGWEAGWQLDPIAALVAHPDEKRLRRLIDLQSWSVAPAGSTALSALLPAIEGCSAGDERLWSLNTFAEQASSFAGEIDPAWDDVFVTSREEPARAFLLRLPPERRDAVVLRHLRDDEHAFSRPWASQIDLLTDAALDQAIACLVARRDPERSARAIELGFGRLGARVEAPLRAHLGGRRDRAARIMVDAARISEAAAAAILGTAPDPPRVKVIGTIANGAAFLDSFAARLRSARPLGRLDMPTGRLALALGVGEGSVTALARAVPPGAYPVFGWRKYIAEPETPTAGVFALAVRFSDATPVRWERDEGFWCEISLCLMDAERGRTDREALESEIERATEDCTETGFALVGKGRTGAFAALVAYIGEGPDNERLYWGIDAEGAPAIAIAGF